MHDMANKRAQCHGIFNAMALDDVTQYDPIEIIAQHFAAHLIVKVLYFRKASCNVISVQRILQKCAGFFTKSPWLECHFVKSQDFRKTEREYFGR